MNSTCLFLMEAWMTEGPRVNFVMRETLFEIYTWILCLSYLHEKQTSRIQSLYLYFIKTVPFWLLNIRFQIHNRAVFRTAGSYVTYISSWKNGFQIFSYVHRSRKHWECKYKCIVCGLQINFENDQFYSRVISFPFLHKIKKILTIILSLYWNSVQDPDEFCCCLDKRSCLMIGMLRSNE